MAKTESEMKKNIKDSLEASGANKEMLDVVDLELDAMELTEDALSQDSCLKKFYSIWNRRKGQRGIKNDLNIWTAYHLGLTSQKPVGDFLPARRFFARASAPDIDTDFQDDRRDEVIHGYLKKKYGEDKVGQLGTYSSLKLRSGFRRIAKVLDIAGAYHKGPKAYTTENEQKCKDILNTLPSQGSKIIWTTEDGQQIEIKTVAQAYEHIPDFKNYIDKCPEVLEHYTNLDNLLSSFGVHASGIIIADEPLANIAPLRVTRKMDDGNKVYATQYTMEDVEACGLIKFDFLGIKTLTVIGRCIEYVKSKYNIDIDIAKIPLDDQRTFDLYKSGQLIGVFQCENYGMQKTCKDIAVDSFTDIMAAIALYRPGPMANIPLYVMRKKGQSKIDYVHPSIEPYVKQYLEETYGLLVYQEQIMQICNSLAGFSITDGYVIIKAVGKKKFDLLAKQKNKFVAGCIKNGVPEDIAITYWDKYIIPFANYGFNKSHACCYAYNSYITAYLKTHYPEEYMLACLNVEAEKKNWDRVTLLERECKKMNMVMQEKSISNADVFYKVVAYADPSKRTKSEISPALMCKDMSLDAAIEIAKNKPFENMREFAMKVGKSVDVRSVEALANAGFFKKKGQLMIEEFSKIREDMKKAVKKGVETADIFG